ncbi:MAG: tRNA (N6-isopentenyl adenosine(37)-C2)-methylthiotransferase MiaB [Dehalococcoidia bacterium]|nr:tRNA (N6-isopentenyl adenosine(37)-C2)-methylthiotransferase MiaB [Dehalococcoidia bacterium]
MNSLNKPVSYHIWTVGCQMNKADSGKVESVFSKWGLQPVSDPGSADVIVLNSCVVRKKAENRVLSKLGDLRALKKKNPGVAILLTGCLVDSQVGELRHQFPHVDLFFGPGRISDLMDWSRTNGLFGGTGSSGEAPSESSTSAYVNVIEGCDNFCSYCIVPYRRGREKSRPKEDILCEVTELARRGVREITLLGQNIDSYGHDLPQTTDLADLLREVNGADGLDRIRFLTSHPKDMKLKLINAISCLDKVCEHINLPVQSGSDEILRSMRRGYSASQYLELIGLIRKSISGVALSTDVIVGYPGETEKQFLETFNLLEQVRFDTVHVAAYSHRPGTWAAVNLKDEVPLEVKKERLNRIEDFQKNVSLEINRKLEGEVLQVLVERKAGEKWMGRTRTDKLVFFQSATGNFSGNIVSVKINRAGPWSLTGELAEEDCIAAA